MSSAVEEDPDDAVSKGLQPPLLLLKFWKKVKSGVLLVLTVLLFVSIGLIELMFEGRQ